MKEKLEQLTAEKEAYEASRDKLKTDAEFIKLQIKAEEKKIKAVQELMFEAVTRCQH